MENKIILAGCVILNDRGKLLLIHRNTPNRIQWETPGGKINEGEDSKQAAKREMEEEIGVKVNILKKLGKRDFQEDNYIMEYIWFLAEVESGQPELMEKDKYDQLNYFTWDQLKEMDGLSPNTQNLISAYFANDLEF